MNQKEYNYWLDNINQIGLKKIERVRTAFGSAEGVFHATYHELMEFQQQFSSATMFSAGDVEVLIQSRNKDKIQYNYAKLLDSGIYFVSKEDNDYPEKLRNIYDAPNALYVRGKLPPKHQKILAIVGARECTEYGREMAKYFAAQLAKEGIGVISGLARGIDSYAHIGALSQGGITYGVLGCGIDICYPKENINLFMEMQKEGAVLSEYAPGIKPLAANFPMRNRIISGLSDAVFVMEAKEKSGSLITVDMGLEQGKDIYALPGKVTDRLSGGCNNLIKMGAKLVTAPKDILEDFLPDYQEIPNDLKKNNKILETDGKIVYACLSFEPMHFEEILIQTGLPMDQVMEYLLLLELSGLITQIRKNYYIIKNI